MRSLFAIQRDIDRAAGLLNRLILEKKLTVAALEGAKVSSEILTEKLMERLRQKEDCGK
jgi:hypothetical protein